MRVTAISGAKGANNVFAGLCFPIEIFPGLASQQTVNFLLHIRNIITLDSLCGTFFGHRCANRKSIDCLTMNLHPTNQFFMEGRISGITWPGDSRLWLRTFLFFTLEGIHLY